MSAHETSVPSELQSSVRKRTNSMAPAQVTGKKRMGAVNSGTTKRTTRRELKKLTEIALEEKDDGCLGAQCAAVGIKAESTPFGLDAASVSITPTSLHDDFVNMMKAQGLEKMATEIGILRNGALVDTPHAATSTPRKARSEQKQASETPTFASPSFTSPSPGKNRRYLKINKGLRHFSMKVCQKVEEKHVTSYNEVADELVREFVTMRSNDSVYDEKNIRRRVYDALNVLMAMDIISKERKEIRWKGLPSNLQHDTEMLLAERNERMKSVEQKKQHLQDLLVQQVAMKNLLKRNAERKRADSENPASANIVRDEGRIFLPFIAVNTSKDTVIQCEMSEDRHDIFFNFSAPFEIHDDADILQKLNLHKAPYAELRQIVPDKLLSYLPAECEMKSEEE
ncbi:unnamed protein product [Hyaloperonospora brassicae]|uniref:E2F/DP family winged-helix DNA-binding domain-containing protein n=1 Tax=Hyaloperonospora brassicae TaxID=162125 RepID=A0AAV0U1I9_HYABA|nr:unnamed protein product [Hyaloperonospora brassicae]